MAATSQDIAQGQAKMIWKLHEQLITKSSEIAELKERVEELYRAIKYMDLPVDTRNRILVKEILAKSQQKG